MAGTSTRKAWWRRYFHVHPALLVNKGPQPIYKLFDFTRKHWVDAFNKSAMRSFDEELELYELLDLDAAGEDDIANDLDEDTAEALLCG